MCGGSLLPPNHHTQKQNSDPLAFGVQNGGIGTFGEPPWLIATGGGGFSSLARGLFQKIWNLTFIFPAIDMHFQGTENDVPCGAT